MRPSLLSAERTARRAATTLPELVVIIAIIAIVTGFVLPPLKRGFDRLQTRAAAHEVMTAFFTARAAAIAAGRRTSVVIDKSRARVSVVASGDTLLARDVGAGRGVTIVTNRDSMTYFPDGLGLGGANLSVIVSRGAAVDTVIVSREGRIKLGTKSR